MSPMERGGQGGGSALDPSPFLCGPRQPEQLEARGLGGACRMTPGGSGQGLRRTSGISPGKEVFPVLEKEVTTIHL